MVQQPLSWVLELDNVWLNLIIRSMPLFLGLSNYLPFTSGSPNSAVVLCMDVFI